MVAEVAMTAHVHYIHVCTCTMHAQYSTAVVEHYYIVLNSHCNLKM